MAQAQTEWRGQYGTIRIYKRHTKQCHLTDATISKCKCSYWIYSYPRNQEDKSREKPGQRSLTTASMAEATATAVREHESLNPAIYAAQRLNKKQEEKWVSIIDAIDLFCNRRDLDSDDTRSLYRSFLGAINPDGTKRGKLFHALAADGIEYVQQVTTPWLQSWHQSAAWNDYKNTTKRQRWHMVRTFFRWLNEQGYIETNPSLPVKATKSNGYYNNIPYDEGEYASILKAAEGDRRLYIFIELMRWTGMDIEDAIQFCSAMVDADGVLTYHRKKTGCEAVIPLEPHMIPLLKSIPLDKHNGLDMPFRYVDTTIDADHNYWYRRVRAAIVKAGITELKYRQTDGVVTIHKPNTKALRHTFACYYLGLGYRIETVARMLGHTRIETTQQHYSPWTKGRNDAHIREVREAQAAAAQRNAKNVVTIKAAR